MEDAVVCNLNNAVSVHGDIATVLLQRNRVRVFEIQASSFIFREDIFLESQPRAQTWSENSFIVVADRIVIIFKVSPLEVPDDYPGCRIYVH
jgi:hypothetical protein